MVIVELSAFASVTGRVLFWPTVTFPKSSRTGKITIGVLAPMPLRVTVWGELVALSAMLSVAVSADGWLGLKFTRNAQLLPGGTVLPQLFCWAKSALSMVTLEISRGTKLPLVRVNFCAVLVVPTR